MAGFEVTTEASVPKLENCRRHALGATLERVITLDLNATNYQLADALDPSYQPSGD